MTSTPEEVLRNLLFVFLGELISEKHETCKWGELTESLEKVFGGDHDIVRFACINHDNHAKNVLFLEKMLEMVR